MEASSKKLDSTSDFDNDQPVLHAKDDLLNRTPFAARLMQVLRDLPRGTGMVIGLYGPWGDGKSTLLNFLRDQAAGDEKLLVRDFNPWRITDDDAMLRGFFSAVSAGINASLKTRGEVLRERSGRIARFARFASKPAALFFKPAESIDQLLEKFVDAVESGKSADLEELRLRLVRQLAKSEVRLVVLIDDIDRLDREETYKIFRLIKACADFPNICYVLAFDDVAVAKTLAAQYGGDGESGRAFLEKIIQLPLKLPIASKADLRFLCLQQVDRALSASGISLTNEEIAEFIAGFDGGVAVKMSTPRAAKRFGNGLMFALPMLKGEVNVSDLLLIEALRAFYPDIYDVVRNHHDLFSGTAEAKQTNDDSVNASELLAPLLSEMPKSHSNAVRGLLKDLFPRLSSQYGGTTYSGSDWLEKWAKQRKVCSPRYCGRYFTYAVAKNDVSRSEIESLLRWASSGDASSVEVWLAEKMRGPTAARVIEHLRLFEDSLQPEAAALIAVKIAELAEGLPNRPALFSFSEPPGQAAILISHLLKRVVDRPQRIEVAARIMKLANPLWFGVECLRWLRVTDEPEKESRNAFTEEELTGIRRVLVDRIKEVANSGVKLFDPETPRYDDQLYEWALAEGREPVQAYLLHLFHRDPSLVKEFLRSQSPQAWGVGSVVPHYSEFRFDTLEKINHIIDLNILAELVIKNCPGDFVNPQKYHDESVPEDERIAERFMYAFANWRDKKDEQGRQDGRSEFA